MITAVTGGSGHIGANLIRQLLEEGRTVRVLARDDVRAFNDLDVDIIRGDILDTASLEALLDGADTVFHTAAKISIIPSDEKEVLLTNIIGTRNMVEAGLKCGIKRFVHFSSIHAFCSEPNDTVITEERKLVSDRHFCYDWSKAAGQHEVLAGVKRGLDAVIVNPTGVLGPNDFKPSHMGQVLLDICHNRLPALINGGYNWVDVRDVVRGSIAAEQRGRTGECYLLSGHWKHLSEISAAIGEITRRKTPTLVAPFWICNYASFISLFWSKMSGASPKFTPYAVKTIQSHRHISHRKAAEELGHSPRPFMDTVRDALEWFEQSGMSE